MPARVRRTTSDLPGAGSPAAVCRWLIDQTQRVKVAAAYPNPPSGLTTAAAAIRLGGRGQRSAGNTAWPSALHQDPKRAQSEASTVQL